MICEISVSGTITQFLYDGYALVAEFNIAGQVARRYAHGPGVDEPIVWYEGPTLANRRWLITDRQGSVIAAADALGALVGTPYRYGPYGEPEDDNWTGSRFRYTGQIALPEAGLYHYKARVYDPGLGRFMQTDPVGYEDDLNLYQYVRNDPLNGADPTGEQFFKLYDPEQAGGFGHVGFGYRDQQSGETTVGEFTGAGELFVSNFTADNGDQAVQGAMAILDSRWESGPRETMNVTIFTEANDTEGFNQTLRGLESITTGEGEARQQGDLTYNLFDCNCGHVANRLGDAAGADVSNNLAPNSQFREERSQPGVDVITTIRHGEDVREWRY